MGDVRMIKNAYLCISFIFLINIMNAQIDEVEKSLSFIDELKNTATDVDKKIEMIEKRYEETGTSPEMKIQEIKHKISWGRDFFKF